MNSDDYKLLIVDDERDYANMLTRFFVQHNFQVEMAKNGKEAIHKAYAGHFDLILMDAIMPEMDGLTAAKRIKRNPRLAGIPIIMLTGFDELKKRQDAARSGIDEFVDKLTDSEELLEIVRSTIRTRDFASLKSKHHGRLMDELDAKTSQLEALLAEKEKLNREILYRIAVAAEYRDDITGKHTDRVGTIVKNIAEAMGLRPDVCDNLRHTAPLHDVGKIGIPDDILLKPGALTDAEWTIMKTHVNIGARILAGSDIPLLVMAKSIALHHHERWDGRGYPWQLAQKEIPIEGRIVAVADTFDAITTKRPYKNAKPYEVGLEIVKQERERQLDPGVVDAFVERYDLIVETIKKLNRKI